METIDLRDYGLTGQEREQVSRAPGQELGRVLRQARGRYQVMTERGLVSAALSGKWQHEAGPLEFPAVGDFVLVTDAEGSVALIRAVLPRRSLFVRRRANMPDEVEQVLCANIDLVFLCMALNHNFNPRRMERYLSIAWESGATPVVVLTKKDLASDHAEKQAEIEGIAIGCDVLSTASCERETVEQLRRYLAPGRTIALLGSSGVGKSTLINCLAGGELLETQETGNDDEGRHTTTHRELFLLPGGGLLMDTPGMRELGVTTADVSAAFADVEELAGSCRFRDCAHQREPGCAVRAAVENGALSLARLRSYEKLLKEQRHAEQKARWQAAKAAKSAISPAKRR